MAGLVCYYGGTKFHYLYVSHDETVGRHVRVMSAIPDGVMADAFSAPMPIPAGGRIELRVEVDEERLLFAFRLEGAAGAWQWLPQHFDASILSDEATAPGQPNFTGAFLSASPARTWPVHRPARGFRLVRIPRARVPGRPDRLGGNRWVPRSTLAVRGPPGRRWRRESSRSRTQ